MTKRELLGVWFQRVWAEEDRSAIYQYYVPEGRAHGLGEVHESGPDAFAQFHTALLAHITHVRIEMFECVEQGDWVSYMGWMTAECRQTGKPVEMTGGAMCLIKDDKIVVAHNAWDFMGLFSQLGLLPENAFGDLLMGEKRSPA